MATATKAPAKARARPATKKPPARGRGRSTANDIPPLEWASAAVGLVLTLVAIGFVGWDAMFGDDAPPSIEVRLLAVTPTAQGFVAEIEAVNHGGSPAAQVTIEGALEGAGPAEVADATLDYVPEHSRASGGLFFQADPRAGRLTLKAKGYADAS